jgi:hypothetical protein
MSNTSPQAGYDGSDSSESGIFAYGIVTFAGFILVIASVFSLLEGIAAAASDSVYVRGLNYTWEFDVTAWGWFHIIIGAIGLAAGIGLLVGQTWARVCGIVIAGLSMLSNFAFMPYYPFWAIVIIAFDVFVIWALCQQISTGD